MSVIFDVIWQGRLTKKQNIHTQLVSENVAVLFDDRKLCQHTLASKGKRTCVLSKTHFKWKQHKKIENQEKYC